MTETKVKFDRYKHHIDTEHLLTNLKNLFPEEVDSMMQHRIGPHSIICAAAVLFFTTQHDPYLLDEVKERVGIDVYQHVYEDVAIAATCFYKARCLPNGKDTSGV